MPHWLRILLVLLCVGIFGALFIKAAYASSPVYVEMVTDQDFSSPDPLEPFDIKVIVHANGNLIAEMDFPFQLKFTNGNILGVMDEWPNGEAQIIYSPASVSTFPTRAFSTSHGQNPTSPDSMFLALVSFGKAWQGTGEAFRIRFTPRDTGTVKFDTFGYQPIEGFTVAFSNPNGESVPFVITYPTIHVPPQPGDVRIRVATSSGTDTLFFGNPATLYFEMDASDHDIAGAAMMFQWTFSNGNVMGSISQGAGQVEFSPAANNAFESLSWNYLNGSPMDTSLVAMVSFAAPGYSTDDYPWKLTFTPTDTGTIFIHSGFDFTLPPACCGTAASDTNGHDVPTSWIPVRIAVVPCPYDRMGDVNQDDVLTSADLIYLINYMFKSGPDPLPERSIADVNCSGGLGGSDIIYMVNYVFKGGAAPCACIVRRI